MGIPKNPKVVPNKYHGSIVVHVRERGPPPFLVPWNKGWCFRTTPPAVRVHQKSWSFEWCNGTSWWGKYDSQRGRGILREPQHTPGAYPRLPQTPKWKEFLHKLLVGGLGYVPGVCWKVLRGILLMAEIQMAMAAMAETLSELVTKAINIFQQVLNPKRPFCWWKKSCSSL